MKVAQIRNQLVLLLGSVLILSQALAQPPDSAEAIIRGKLQQARPDFQISSVQPSVVDGIYEVQIGSGPVLYATADGDFFFLGDLFSVGVSGIVNLAVQQRDRTRKTLIDAVSIEDMVVFSPERETRTHVTVFTDVDCFYCQKFHKEVPAMNAKGIEVRYLAYPRSGIGGESYRKIASAWCAKDRRKAMTMLKNRESIPDNVCANNPVADQFMIGQQAGVRGTPALVLESGELLPGYLSADDLAGRLGIN
ncbi:MAG: DsbC family protein [Gammaproteobacteria bacterium]|nr:DsbC family protein [Gammaproteobacteria bacterium]